MTLDMWLDVSGVERFPFLGSEGGEGGAQAFGYFLEPFEEVAWAILGSKSVSITHHAFIYPPGAEGICYVSSLSWRMEIWEEKVNKDSHCL